MEPEQQQQREVEKPNPEEYFYSPMTDQYYRRERLYDKPDGPGKDVLIDLLIGAAGIICGPRVGDMRFCDTRMMSEQSGRVGRGGVWQ